MATKKRVVMLGSGNWGCAVAQIIGWNTSKLADYEERVNMYVFEEIVKKRKLTEIINTQHENVKYLPGHKLPDNVVAVPDAAEAAKDADVVVICLPHQFLPRLLASVKEVIKPGAVAVSLIKGHVEIQDGRPVLGSKVINDTLGVETAVLMGANVANEVARGDFCEATLSTQNPSTGAWLKHLFDRPTFRVTATVDVPGTELCGGLKNVIALGAGFCDGLGLGDNTKAAILRAGLLEMSLFIQHFFPNSQRGTLFESCGVADLITTSYGGRNRKCAEAYARDPTRGWDRIEKELLGGQKLQGVSTIIEIWPLIEVRRLRRQLPLIRCIHRIAVQGAPPSSIAEFANMEGPQCSCTTQAPTRRVVIFGGGSWATAISLIICKNCIELEEFNNTVTMYAYDEIVEGQSLCEIINTRHENIKYLPDHKLPDNLVAVPDAAEAVKDADILVFCVQLQFLPALLATIKNNIKPGAVAVSLIKGSFEVKNGQPVIVSKVIQDALGVETAVLSGANIATEVARGDFSEATLGTSGPRSGDLLALLFNRSNFYVREVHDVASVDMAAGIVGALSLAGGICDGIGFGGNTKAAIIRMGLLDMSRIIAKFFPTAKRETLFESCGMAYLVGMSMARADIHRKCAESFAKFMASAHRLSGKPNGMKVDDWEEFAAQVWDDVYAAEHCEHPGDATLKDLWSVVQSSKLEEELPLVSALYRVAIKGQPPSSLVAFGNIPLAPLDSPDST